MEPKQRPKNEENLDFSEKWTRHQRRSTKTTVNLSCQFCKDRRIFQTDDLLWLHILDSHAEKIPPKDTPEFEKFRALCRSQRVASITHRPSRDDSATKPHEDLSTLEPELPSQSPLDDGLQSPCVQTPLTESLVKKLPNDQANKRDGSMIKHTDNWGSKSLKKRAIGDGKSPSSSVQTACSNDSQRLVAELSSPQRSSPSKLLGDRTTDYTGDISRPPVTPGKRLFQPDFDSPFTAQNSTSPTHSRLRKANQKHTRNKESRQSPVMQHLQRPLSAHQPGTIPISVLSANPLNQQVDFLQSIEASRIVRQPETRSISQEQLIAEVKGIYAGLVMVEGKCIQVDLKQAAIARNAPPGKRPKLNNEQWQALIALHRTLLHEHHDFFLASQHPSATPGIRNLADKYAMPARLWRHGIHSFLELLRNRLPESLDHMLAFIYLAYNMMTLLFETVPAFEGTWIECLGDLGRYRMAIEDDDIRDREVWTQVARQWYLKASDRSPETGRLYHHLAILARPNILQQLFFYNKALSVPQPFIAAKESILTLFQPGKHTRRSPPVIAAYIKVHAILFTGKNSESFEATVAEFIGLLESHISWATSKYLEQAYYIAISNCLALLSFGSPDAVLSKALAKPQPSESADQRNRIILLANAQTDTLMFEKALKLFTQTVAVNLRRVDDANILSFLHVILVFMAHISRSAPAMKLLERDFPWHLLVTMLNTLIRLYHNYPRIESEEQPVPDKNDFRPAPEEFAMRGLPWTVDYFSPDWFDNKNIEDENQYKEDPSMNSDYRPERILWLGSQIAKAGKWIIYNSVNHEFSVTPATTAIDSFAGHA